MEKKDLNRLDDDMDAIQREYENFLIIKNKFKPWFESFVIIIKYIIMGVLWIILSDKVVAYLVEDTEALKELQLFKGWFYVFVTGAIFFLIIKRVLVMYSNSIDKILTGYEELFLAHEELMSMNEELISMNDDLREYIDTIEIQKNEMQRSEQRYELAVDGANDGIWDWDLKTGVYFLPLRWKNMLGYNDDELNSMDHWSDLFHPDDKDQAMLILKEYLNKKTENYHCTFRLKCKSGEYCWILSRGKCIWDENGQPLRMSGSHSDITEYMQLQELLWVEKELSTSIIMEASSIIIVFDTEEKIIQFNPFAEKTFGFKKEEVIGKIGGEVLTSTREKTEMREMFQHILDGNSLNDNEIEIRCKDGSFKTILWNNNILHDEKGRITGLVSIGTDISERREMEDKLKLVAYYDSLTGLPNRAYLEKMAVEMILNDEKFAIVNMDIDNFKQINDTMGHAVGDSFIQYIAKILSEAIDEPDIVVRLSGDEFAILFNLKEGRQKLISLLRQIQFCIKNPWNINDQKFHITSSMGIAVYPEHGNDISALMQNADIAMFYQKEHGKDGYVMFQSAMYEKILRNVHMSNMLKEAIENDEFLLYYQPQLDLTTGSIVGVEALIRWNHPQKGFIPPAEFIPYSEQTGYIIPISQWVLKKAITQKKEWERKGYPPIKMAVNLSGYIFTENAAFDSICSILNSMNIKPGEIEVEVTETAVMMELDKAQNSINKLKQMGISIAMDDFGTGYSSLNYLQILPIDILKIDRGFIQNLTENKQIYIYQTVVELAHALGLIVVAEGIETEEQKDFLIQNSCDIGQGYYFSKPVPAFEIERIFEQELWKRW